ncbi:hypothetical protein NC651_016745 [Populus alba x Populus x berolinensis]|nr:hypothetical protein NC651_016745 [Populus alba x Populus x berolinensis]
MKSILAYSSIGQIGYAIGGIIIVDSNEGYANTNLYVFLYLYGSRNFCLYCNICSTHQINNIQDYTKLHTILSSFDTFLLRTRLLISYLNIFL